MHTTEKSKSENRHRNGDGRCLKEFRNMRGLEAYAMIPTVLPIRRGIVGGWAKTKEEATKREEATVK